MKKINLDQNEQDALDQFVKSGANYTKVIEKVFKEGIADLKDINNIDPKGNMGLQTLARQEAVKVLVEIAEMIFPDQEKLRASAGPQEKKISKWR